MLFGGFDEILMEFIFIIIILSKFQQLYPSSAFFCYRSPPFGTAINSFIAFAVK